MIYTFCLGLLLGALIVNIYLKDMEKQRDNAELRAVTHFRKLNEIENIIKSEEFTFDQIEQIKRVIFQNANSKR